ncbi:tail fiber domain-containing protein [Flavobacteriaceae bacterium LSUCC0859]|nr:tail fiber domain-containing protein [Flavobacteriaceae bacterium LSUCC0859]
MKNLILSFSALFITFVSYAQVGIGVTTPHASAALEVVATNNDKGILITRLTKSQRDAISAPATGLLVYQIDNSPGLYFFNGISWAAVGKDNLGNHLLTQSLDLNGEAITDNTDASTELTIQSLVNDKDVHIKSYDEIYLTTINGDDGVTQDPLGTVYDTYGDIELKSADDIILTANKYVKLIANGDDNDLSIELNADQDIKVLSGDDILIDAEDVITISNGDNIILDSGNDIELKVTSGDFVEIWEDGDFLYTLPGSRGTVGQFLQRSSDGSSEFFSNWSSYKLPTADGTNGQILTTDGSGTVSWATPSGGASSLNDLSDVVTFGTSSLILGHSTTGTINAANYNLGVGQGTQSSITTGDYNTTLGFEALKNNEVGSFNVALGYEAALNLAGTGASQQGSSNIAIGYRALRATTSTAETIAIGKEAISSGTLTGGYGNIAVGTRAAQSLAGTQVGVTAIGHEALQSNQSGYTTAVGMQALKSNTSGFSNDAFGYQALQNNTTGGSNVAIGRGALTNVTTSWSNTAIGNGAGYNVTSGGNSVFVGNSAGSSTTAKALGNDNIYIGAGSKPSVDGVYNEIVIGRNAVGNGSNTITLGHTTNTAVYARGTVYSNGTALNSDRRLKTDIKSVANGLSTVMKLNPVSYNKRLSFDTEEYNKKEIGFIAQEVQEILPDLVSVGPDENKTLSLDYNSLIPILTKAIQEQQVLIEALKAKVERLESNN